MNWDRLRLVAGPEVTPLPWASAKAHLRLDDELPADEEARRQTEVEQLVAAAVAMVDGPNGIGIAMISQTWRLTLDAFSRRVLLPIWPVRSIAEVSYVDPDGVTRTVEAGDYQLDDGANPAVLTPTFGTCWPSTRCAPRAVRIDFVAGYGDAPEDLPADLVAALKLILGSLYDGDGSVTAAARAILNRYAVIAPG